MAMTRVSMDGKTINKRTYDMINRAEARMGFDLWIVQGSYNDGVSASAGTHDGGGAIDFSVRGLSESQIREAVWQLRCVGFAAWYRAPRAGVWGAHIHAIAIGDGELSSGARAQVQEYYAGYDGLAGNGRDTWRRPDPIPVWPIPTPDISLGRAKAQFEATKKRKVLAVQRIQKLLNKRLAGEDLVVDGIAGPKTRAAYKRWEAKIDAPETDGIPGWVSLKQLVAGYYRVVK